MLKSTLAACGFALSAVAIAAPMPSATMLSNTCAGCHGTNGTSQGPAIPTIGGMDSESFVEIMQAYKDASRPSTIMTRVAKGYSDEEIEAMGGFFAKQPFGKAVQQFDAAAAAKGAKIHKKLCKKCHEDGDEDSFPLGGQWIPYLKHSFADLKEGRDMPKKMKKKMKKLYKKHGEDGVNQLINFYGSQQ